jgi:hypothetical protein
MPSRVQVVFSVVLLFVLSLMLPSLAYAAGSVCNAVAGNLVANCGFETGDFTGWTLTGNPGFISIISSGTGNGGTSPNSGNFAAQRGDASRGKVGHFGGCWRCATDLGESECCCRKLVFLQTICKPVKDYRARSESKQNDGPDLSAIARRIYLISSEIVGAPGRALPESRW